MKQSHFKWRFINLRHLSVLPTRPRLRVLMQLANETASLASLRQAVRKYLRSGRTIRRRRNRCKTQRRGLNCTPLTAVEISQPSPGSQQDTMNHLGRAKTHPRWQKYNLRYHSMAHVRSLARSFLKGGCTMQRLPGSLQG